MKHEAEGKIEDSPDDDGDDVVFHAANGKRRSARIAAAFERYAIVYRPRQHRSKKNNSSEVAVGAQMRESPRLYSSRHRVLQHALNVAADVSRGHHDARRPHQRFDNMVRPQWRIPDRNQSGGAVLGKAVADQSYSDDRYEGEQAPVRADSHFADKRRALIAH